MTETRHKSAIHPAWFALPAIHILILFLLWQSQLNHLLDPETLTIVSATYFIFVPIVLVISFYRELRNLAFYVIWLLLGIGHIFLFAFSETYTGFEVFNQKPVRALPVVLLSLHIFRLLYKSLKKQELIITYGRSIWYDEYDDRDITWLDVVFSILIYASAVLVCIF